MYLPHQGIQVVWFCGLFSFFWIGGWKCSKDLVKRVTVQARAVGGDGGGGGEFVIFSLVLGDMNGP